MDDPLQKCLAWTQLQNQGRSPHRKALDPLVQAGIAELQGREVVLVDHETLSNIIESQCSAVIQARDEANELISSMGLDVSITSKPMEALALLRELHRRSAHEKPCHVQSLSSALFQDSKHILRFPVLNKIYSNWSQGLFQRGELRVRSWSDLHHRQGLNLKHITRTLGQACIQAGKASKTENFDFSEIRFVLTTENLAPFMQLELKHGLLIFCQGYASALPGLWLKNLPLQCKWVHFGDFDPDGLFIFEQLLKASKRKGHFFPDLPFLQRYRDRLAPWNASRKFDPEKYQHDDCKELALWGKENNVYAEQEWIMEMLGPDRVIAAIT
ncbi:Wadjet anti-phage system protein JetD domain-containing protein [Desulfonatronovibrio magnus]|uniref:Wadjet anti-phage system protein JetD domain-containing protein n=1 Tax=Desulfonatronovibrio magnus TaxID=698827 RepID=UPI0009FDC61C|nr:Wadjet anti-phage system protein JetD domain-containing protein [Desulfonatronovibrio magnus]RQD60243.1 MAG: hypothetical protein D5R98_07215 [Desulfonatronovibrio sp. MSAO_Bac4]